MKIDKNNAKLWFAVIGTVLSVTILIGVVIRYHRAHVPIPPELWPERPLPSDPVEAEQVVESRDMRDSFMIKDEEIRKKRHEKRLEMLEEVKRKAKEEKEK